GLILVSQSAPHQHQAFRLVCHLQHGEIVAPPDAEVFGFDDIVGDASVTQLAYAGVGRYADLVHAVFGTDDKHVLAAQRAEYVQHDIDPDELVDPQQLIGGGSGVRQWPEQIEYGANAAVLARGGDVTHGTGVAGREHEPGADPGDALCHLLGAQRQLAPGGFQRSCAATAAGCTAV